MAAKGNDVCWLLGHFIIFFAICSGIALEWHEMTGFHLGARWSGFLHCSYVNSCPSITIPQILTASLKAITSNLPYKAIQNLWFQLRSYTLASVIFFPIWSSIFFMIFFCKGGTVLFCNYWPVIDSNISPPVLISSEYQKIYDIQKWKKVLCCYKGFCSLIFWKIPFHKNLTLGHI